VPIKLFVLSLCFIVNVSLSISLHAAEQPKLTHGLSSLTHQVNAPDLQLNNLDEEIVDIKALKGQVIIVNFWATWCPPCRREMASLERLYQATKDKGVVVLAVNVGEDDDTVFSFLGEVEPSPTYPILFDTNAQSLKDWKVKGLPTTYIVDGKGKLVYRAIGGREFDHPELIKKVLSVH